MQRAQESETNDEPSACRPILKEDEALVRMIDAVSGGYFARVGQAVGRPLAAA